MRKILNIFKIKNRSIIDRKNSNIIKAIHLHYPPRIENNTKKNLILIEVQTGNYLEEDDIYRFEDKYNR